DPCERRLRPHRGGERDDAGLGRGAEAPRKYPRRPLRRASSGRHGGDAPRAGAHDELEGGMSTGPIIRAAGLTKRFGDFTAVDALAFEVAPGSIFAFLGANGSGKSTTIRMLIGLLTPTAGTIEVDGIDVIKTPRRVRDHIGYMGQKVSLYQGLSLRENVEFYGGLYGLGDAELEQRWAAMRER